MSAFLKGFAEATGLSAREADEQWAAYSRQLSDPARRQIERGGRKAGQIMGQQYRRDYPEENTP